MNDSAFSILLILLEFSFIDLAFLVNKDTESMFMAILPVAKVNCLVLDYKVVRFEEISCPNINLLLNCWQIFINLMHLFRCKSPHTHLRSRVFSLICHKFKLLTSHQSVNLFHCMSKLLNLVFWKLIQLGFEIFKDVNFFWSDESPCNSFGFIIKFSLGTLVRHKFSIKKLLLLGVAIDSKTVFLLIIMLTDEIRPICKVNLNDSLG